MDERKASHLRLVSTRDAASGPDKASSDARGGVRRHAEQLALPYLDPFTIVFANVQSIDQATFANIMASLRPKWIIDARVTPRMDILAGTRSNAFKIFGSYGVEYVDLFGQLGLGTYRSADVNPNLWIDTVGEMIATSRKPMGPYLALFDNDNLMSASKIPFVTTLNKSLGQETSLALFP
jgi:hypothetical protein